MISVSHAFRPLGPNDSICDCMVADSQYTNGSISFCETALGKLLVGRGFYLLMILGGLL